MGRKSLNRTDDELREQKRLRNQRYHQRHKDKIQRNQMERYYGRKNGGGVSNNQYGK